MTRECRMELIKPAGRILVEEMRQAIDRLRGCVVPIYDTDERREAVLLSSGVLINISESAFFATSTVTTACHDP